MAAAIVIVLGDIGRSPRMMNHARSLIATDYIVHMIGYNETKLPNDLINNEKLKIYSLTSSILNKIKSMPRYLFLLYALLRIIIESFQLLLVILTIKNAKFILIQNPPSIPTIFLALLGSWLKNIPLCIDWHNYGFSLLQIAKKSSKIVKIAYAYEKVLGKFSDGNFCVSNRMKKHLEETMGIKSTTLYDKPRRNLAESSKNMRDELNLRGFLIVSSTSFTEDEDFSIVISALDKLETVLTETEYITLVITGKGPLKDYYKNLISQKTWKKSKVIFAWLEAEDYPTLLKQADLGVCLHISSSGYDLPMKVVDMHAAALPALAFYYDTIEELVISGRNGDTFKNSQDLAEKIEFLIRNPSLLKKYRDELLKEKKENYWEDVWVKAAKPVLNGMPKNKASSWIFRIILSICIAKLITYLFF
ncbi:unnamed protein product [Blepharisma stoltei]|uniref:Beta-1,4-mannosyltransferase n=1 Tax=Blepharisma stoltei TaxID=1481888 RepID=A0AAU9K9G7_9CILI|nr:unnamed protein product [Blepharisma stoltei]